MKARLKLAPRWVAVAAALVAVAGLMVVIGRQADAATVRAPVDRPHAHVIVTLPD